jgi:hypothetical protein
LWPQPGHGISTTTFFGIHHSSTDLAALTEAFEEAWEMIEAEKAHPADLCPG